MTINGSVYAPTELMTEGETMESFCDGLSMCASAARELATECQNPEWADIANTLDAMKDGGKKLLNMKAMSRLETLMATNLKTTPYKPS